MRGGGWALTACRLVAPGVKQGDAVTVDGPDGLAPRSKGSRADCTECDHVRRLCPAWRALSLSLHTGHSPHCARSSTRTADHAESTFKGLSVLLSHYFSRGGEPRFKQTHL